MIRPYRLDGLPAPGPIRSRVDADVRAAGFRRTPRLARNCFVLDVDEKDEAVALTRTREAGIVVAGRHVTLTPYVPPEPTPEEAPVSPVRLLAIPAISRDYVRARSWEAAAFATTRAVDLPPFARRLRARHRKALAAFNRGQAGWVDHPLSIEVYFLALLFLREALLKDRPPELDIEVTLAGFARSINASSARREALLSRAPQPVPEIVFSSLVGGALGLDLDDDGASLPPEAPDALAN